jgi:predicted transposase YbfD/YdcC
MLKQQRALLFWFVMVEIDIADSFLDYFSGVEDPREDWNRLYSTTEILFLTFCAIACGANSWRCIEAYGKSKTEFLRKFFPYKNGAPSDDTIRRFFRALNPKVFQEKFREWILNIFPNLEEQVIAIDGKTSRGSLNFVNEEKHVLHMVSAYATEANLVLVQEKVSDKSNEITAIPQLLETLDIRGATITIDAMGCQYKIADQIIEQKGQYVLALKGNQDNLHNDVVTAFNDTQILERSDIFETMDKGHGRIEMRKCSVFSDVNWLKEMNPKWHSIGSIVRIDSRREIKNEITEETRYYIASQKSCAEKMLKIIRSHWAIENSMHWILDMSFGEDQSRIRKGNAPQNMAIVRHIVLNLFKIAKKKLYPRESIRILRLTAAWNDDVLLNILQS